jgi:hypothetical protein
MVGTKVCRKPVYHNTWPGAWFALWYDLKLLSENVAHNRQDSKFTRASQVFTNSLLAGCHSKANTKIQHAEIRMAKSISLGRKPTLRE